MDANQIIDRIQERREPLDTFGVRSLALFRLVARGEELADSDVDLLVGLEGPTTFDHSLRELSGGLRNRGPDASRTAVTCSYLQSVGVVL